ncbi:hypothetical protein QK289_14320 [Exiguobacterium antarcticum]|uniref:Lipoprotein n=1 Tax=Exiguobacterium antarcticum TaxID=132920 RepID=A0ABT6R7C0_9BACL|nr:hypothetical protein [Exiguobacterium antarcticum]MDI3236186.1 hypothetical protein [Exiguobacterium antarcticum]
MKRLFIYLGVFLLICGLFIAYSNEKEDRIVSEHSEKFWKKEATMYKLIPSYDKKAEKFLTAYNEGEGEHAKFLTGDALDEYQKALDQDSEYQEEHSHHEDLDTTLNETNILMIHSEVDKEGQYHSKILFELDFEGPANSEEQGVIDKRVVTMIMDIDWINEKINRYNVSWFNDTLGTNEKVKK